MSAASLIRFGVNANVEDWILDENDEDLVFPLPKKEELWVRASLNIDEKQVNNSLS
jgi:hypothetical protein